jgi:hypothetical protein
LSSAAVWDREILLPPVRGRWTESLYGLLGEDAVVRPGDGPSPGGLSVLHDHDLQMALYLCYELHYAGIAGVASEMEWNPLVLMLRAAMEEEFERAIRSAVLEEPRPVSSVGEELQRYAREDDGPPLSRYAQTQATLAQFREHVIHRSAYQLKEADPHSWVIPRLSDAAKTALVEVQSDEYGGGKPERMHSTLFAGTMRVLGLDPTYGAYLAVLPGITLATVNLMSWCGLHRRLRGAVVGHLTMFEITSSNPNRRYGDGLRRLGFGREATFFYDEHVEADAVHESIATWDLADALARAQPELAPDILFGARALLALEALWADHLLESWRRGETSLLQDDPELAGAV